MAEYREAVKALFREAAALARREGVQAPGHAGGIYHYVDEELEELLTEVLAEPVDARGTRHDEGEMRTRTEGGKKTYSIRCTCEHETGWYPLSRSALSAFDTHLYDVGAKPRG